MKAGLYLQRPSNRYGETMSIEFIFSEYSFVLGKFLWSDEYVRDCQVTFFVMHQHGNMNKIRMRL